MTADATPTATGGRVFACGYYGFGNEGDEAILEGLRAGLQAQRSGLSWVVTSGDPEHTARRHGVRAKGEVARSCVRRVGLSYDPEVEAALRDSEQAESVVRLDELPGRDLARMLDEARPVDPAYVDGLRRRALASARRAVDVMESGEPARLTPTLGAIVLDAWRTQLQRLSAEQQDAVHRLEELRRRWETLTALLQQFRSNPQGHQSLASQGH